MRVLLNTTADELVFVGGDQVHYQHLHLANTKAYGFTTAVLQHTSPAFRQRVRLLEALARKVPVRSLRARLFTEGRRVPISSMDLSESHADVVYSVILAARLPTACRVASVFYSQGINSPQYYQYKGDLTVEEVAEFYRFLAPHVTLMIVGTQDGLNRLHEMCPNLACPTLFVPQPVLIKPNSNLDDKLPKDRVRLLFVGRDYIRKGLPEVLAAYREVARHAELHVVTAPDCPLMTETTDLPYVTWYADLSDESLQRLYRRSHILVVPTHADTYNLVMVEAMANGCAVVTSDLSPMDEIAPPGVVGETVPRGDVDALADTLKVLVQDRVRLERYMRAALHRYQTEYAPDRVLPRLANAFEYAVSLAR